MAVDCTAPTDGSDYIISQNCAPSGNILGVEDGNIVINQGYTLTLNTDQILVFNPNRELQIYGIISKSASGSRIEKSFMWMEDKDSDGWAAATTTRVVSNVLPTVGWARQNTIQSLDTIDCDDNSYSALNSCCTLTNGGWSNWLDDGICGAYTACEQRQTRTCTNPVPSCGGASCIGEVTQNIVCGVINGGWSYGSWSACSSSCQNTLGTQSRSAACDNPAPTCGGAACSDAVTSQYCYGDTPTTNGWYSYGSWSACSSTCQTIAGTQTRSATCNQPVCGGAPCSGAVTSQTCYGSQTDRNCVGSWSSCSSCSKTYTITTTQRCNGTSCPYSNGQTQSCGTVNGGWCGYGACSGTCPNRYRYRTCGCPAPACGGASCSGSNRISCCAQ